LEKQKTARPSGRRFQSSGGDLFGEFSHHTSSGTFVPDQGHLSSSAARLPDSYSAACVHARGIQAHPQSVRRRYRMAWPRIVWSVSRPAARRFSSPHVAGSRFGLGRDCVYDAQDGTAHRAAARATARRLFGITASERLHFAMLPRWRISKTPKPSA
jgi:hypothetical protein